MLANSRSGFSSPTSPTTPSAVYQLSFAHTYPITVTATRGPGASRFLSIPKIHDKWPDLQRKAKGWVRKPKKQKHKKNRSPCEKHAFSVSLSLALFSLDLGLSALGRARHSVALPCAVPKLCRGSPGVTVTSTSICAKTPSFGGTHKCSCKHAGDKQTPSGAGADCRAGGEGRGSSAEPRALGALTDPEQRSRCKTAHGLALLP